MAYTFIKEKKILEISLQHKEEVYLARDFNKEHNYEYIIVDTNNLIDYNNLAYLLRIGYVLNEYADRVELRWKDYNYENEKIDGEGKL